MWFFRPETQSVSVKLFFEKISWWHRFVWIVFYGFTFIFLLYLIADRSDLLIGSVFLGVGRLKLLRLVSFVPDFEKHYGLLCTTIAHDVGSTHLTHVAVIRVLFWFRGKWTAVGVRFALLTIKKSFIKLLLIVLVIFSIILAIKICILIFVL